MNFAGIPPTIVLSGTSLETTAPAATMAFSPMVTPGKIVALAPIHAFFLMWIGFPMSPFLCSGSKGRLSVIKLTFGPIKTSS